jgi:hypothetical protein
MTPKLTAQYLAEVRTRYFYTLRNCCNGRSTHSCFASESNLLNAKLYIWSGFSPLLAISALELSIPIIFENIAASKVLRITASWVITRMQNQIVAKNMVRSLQTDVFSRNDSYEAMRVAARTAAVDRKLSVSSTQRSRPIPARIWTTRFIDA